MPVLTVGVSYRRAPLALLERLSFPVEELPKSYRRLADAECIREAVILSTCNRVEVTAEVSAYHEGIQALKLFLSEDREMSLAEFAESLSTHYEDDAVEHLFRVAAGLDSMVLGESQILSQVRQAYRLAGEEGSAGPTLSALCSAAVRTGRRVRGETQVGASPAAFVDAGADVAGAWLGGLEGRAAAVVGAGQMARLAVDVLRDRGAGSILIVNRSPDRAHRLAQRAGAEAHGLERLRHALAAADVVIACTGAAGIVVAREDLDAAIDGGIRRMAFVDLAVPRDVDPAIAEIPGVRVADIDVLAGQLGAGGPVADLDRANEIVGEEVARYGRHRRAARLAPLIQRLNEVGDRAVKAEIARLEPRLAGLSGRERDAMEALARGVVAKLLHRPISRLKEDPASARGDRSRALADLFGIEFLPEE